MHCVATIPAALLELVQQQPGLLPGSGMTGNDGSWLDVFHNAQWTSKDAECEMVTMIQFQQL